MPRRPATETQVEARKEWKRRFNGALDASKGRITAARLAKEINVVLVEMGAQVLKVSPTQVAQWRSLGASSLENRASQLRVPPRAEIANALVNALDRLDIWSGSRDRTEEMSALTHGLGYELLDLAAKKETHEDLIDNLLETDIVLLSSVLRSSGEIHTLNMVSSDQSRWHFINFILKGGRWLVISAMPWTSHQESEQLPALSLPPLFSGYFVALGLAAEEAANRGSSKEDVLRSFYERVRFAVINSDDQYFHVFCRPRLRILMGLKVNHEKSSTTELPLDWWAQIGVIIAFKEKMVLEQHDDLVTTTGERATNVIGKVANASEVDIIYRWMSEKLQEARFFEPIPLKMPAETHHVLQFAIRENKPLFRRMDLNAIDRR